MRRDIYVMAMLTLALLVEPVVGAYTFISPADQSSYTKGATIAFVGNGGGSPGSAYVVEFRKESGTVEQLKSGTCGQMNMC
ncbi:MAG TPA: hypothetical protein VM165_00210 [Planctomycetaceae bacterium]|nr:hypothetical protein [Planctomycetaceae bacterium]